MVPDSSYGSYRRVFAAVIGCLILWSAEGLSQAPKSPSVEEQSSSSANGGAAIPDPPPSLRRLLQSNEDAAAEKEREAKAAKHDEDDLAAQWKAANAASDAAYYAKIGVIITLAATLLAGAGTIYVIGTFRETRRAARAAEAAVHGDRAWICLSGTNTKEFTDGHIDGVFVRKGVAISLIWANKGRSPALNVNISRDFKWVDDDETPPAFVDKTPPGRPQKASIGPDQDIKSPPVAFSEEDIMRLVNRLDHLFLYGIVHYNDVFSPNIWRYTEVCGRVRFAGYTRQKDGSTGFEFEFSPIGPQNSAS